MSALVSLVTEVLLKAVGMALVGRMAAHLCRDAGESALAEVLQLASRLCILAVSLPLVLQLMDFFEELTTL